MIISDQMYALDPEISRFAELLVSGAPSAQEVLTLEQIRKRAITLRLPLNLGGPEMPVFQHNFDDGQVSLRIRIHRPTASSPEVIFYFHGGGWSLLNLDCFDRVMREYANASGKCVVGVEYPLAPEHPYPAAINAMCSLLDHWDDLSSQLQLSPRFAFAGDSAGANLALATALKRRNEGKSGPSALILHYGVYDSDLSRPSYTEFGNGTLPLSAERMKWFWANYCPDAAARNDSLVSPLRADLRALPPTFMIIADHDILFDENISMARVLKSAGSAVEMKVYPGTTHAFVEAIAWSSLSRRAVVEASQWLRTFI